MPVVLVKAVKDKALQTKAPPIVLAKAVKEEEQPFKQKHSKKLSKNLPVGFYKFEGC